MAIHTQQVNQIEGGFAKEIDKGSERMVFDNLQRTQYSYPEKSTVRELTSNGIDSIRERDIAISIISGKSTIADHYVVLEGDEYKDSYFDHMYYDPQWLSDDPNVYITYKEGSMLEKDKIIIRDNGVGLWGKRLEGYFKLAWSSKRLSRFGLGKFGIGAKAPLSTGVPYYKVITRYNGREMIFDVYSYQVVPTVPRLNMQTGQENPSLTLSNGAQCYYQPTTEKNGLEIILETKKHHKQRYIDAVKSQLLYFQNIVFKLEASNGVVEQVEVSAKILYEDDIMILSDNKLYSKPHILINKVNYGNIDFQELELEDKMGNISIKMRPEEVSVSPSREHVLWDEITREMIIKRFKEVQAVSEGLLQKELNQSDFMKWLKACIVVKNKINTEQADGLVARLAKLVDLQNYVPVYKPDPEFKLDRNLFAGVKARKIYYKSERHGSKYETKVAREQVGLSDLVNENIPVLIQRSDTNWMRDRYLLDTLYPEGFITIWLNNTEVEYPVVTETMTEEDAEKIYIGRKQALFTHAKDTALELRWLNPLVDERSQAQYVKEANEAIERVLNRWNKLNKYVLESEGLQHYESFEVPENYLKNQTETEEGTVKQEAEVQTREAQLSAEERRKLSGKTILFTPRIASYENKAKELYTWDKMEIPVAEIDEWKNPEVFYSSDDNASLLQLAAFITRPGSDPFSQIGTGQFAKDRHGNDSEITAYRTAYDGNPTVKLIKVAQNRIKYYLDFKHIHQFFAQVNTKNKTITMSNALIRWNTARYVHQYLSQLRFLENFKSFNEEYATLYQQMKNYAGLYYREVGNYTGKYKEIKSAEYDDMIKHLDKVTELQVFVREHKDDSQAIANLVRELFGTGLENTVTDGCGIDMNIRDIVHKLLDYAEPIACMLNQLPALTGQTLYCDNTDNSIPAPPLTEELETEIRNYIEFKRAGL